MAYQQRQLLTPIKRLHGSIAASRESCRSAKVDAHQ
jgi:hypothetical protein